jgi:Tfp pilus assembly protein PilV
MLRRIARTLRKDEGFGLIELTIALTMLAIGISALGGLFVAGHFALRRATQSDTAAVLSDKLLERFRAETWDTVAVSKALFDQEATDTTYTGDAAYSLSTAVTDSSGLCQGLTPGYSACWPSRAIPDTSVTPHEVAPDARRYRLDTYVNWGCSDGAAPDMSTSPPTCSYGPFSQVKIVTIVVRDATSAASLAGAPVYRLTSTFDRLAGGSMPTVTVTPSTPGSTTTTTAGTTSSTSAPAAPTSVALANGGGTGAAYINDANKGSLSVDVDLPSTSVASDSVALTVSDGIPDHDVDQSLNATQGAGIIHFTLINGSAFVDGPITISVTASNTYGTSVATTTTVTKDTVAPHAPTSVALANGQGSGSAYVNSATKSSVSVTVGLDLYSLNTDTVNVTLANGATSSGAVTTAAPTGVGTATVTGVDASALGDGSLTANATVTDVAGNTSASVASASFTKDTVAPTLASIASANKTGGTSHAAEAGDTVTLTFSEAILASSVAASSNVTISVANGANKPVTLAIPNVVASGGFTIGTSGTTGYLKQAGGSVAFNSSALSQPSSTQVRVTLAACSGNCSNLQAGGSVSVTLGPASALTDLAGNSVGSTTISPSAMTFF